MHLCSQVSSTHARKARVKVAIGWQYNRHLCFCPVQISMFSDEFSAEDCYVDITCRALWETGKYTMCQELGYQRIAYLDLAKR